MDETVRAQKLQKNLEDTKAMGEKQRFGMFSQPPPLAISDNSMFEKKPCKCQLCDAL